MDECSWWCNTHKILMKVNPPKSWPWKHNGTTIVATVMIHKVMNSRTNVLQNKCILKKKLRLCTLFTFHYRNIMLPLQYLSDWSLSGILYMFDRNPWGKTFLATLGDIECFGFFETPAERQLTCKSWLDTSCPDCHPTSKIELHKTYFYKYSRSLFQFCWMWIFPWIKLSWHSCSMWDKLSWLNWFRQFLCEGLSSFNSKRFYYSYAWSYSLHQRRTSFCMDLISRKLCRLLLRSLTGFTSLCLTSFPLSITFFIIMHGFWFYFT